MSIFVRPTGARVRHYAYGMFDDLGLDLRETCSKIARSDVMEPRTRKGWEPYGFDVADLHGNAKMLDTVINTKRAMHSPLE